MHILAFFALFSPYFRATINILYNKKTQKPLCLLRFRGLLFFPVKTDNPLILYIFISLVYAVFAMTREGNEIAASLHSSNDRKRVGTIEGKLWKTVEKGLPESLVK